ncbi:ATP12 family chaperone protein [Fodinicurvata sediminis]|uniref:ATP12 family chaperone protein n=1 Tax=Fodinicurvata sediminis TaxID=1121832 RepID=UPI0003B5508D|nr:ATP12 family protein [Fodinicurvata sediminis]
MIQATKRFYKRAEPAEVEGGYGIFLDGRPVKTPGRQELALPSRLLADALAAEWDSQEEQLEPEAMPLTALAFTARDIVAPKRPEVVDEIVAYSETDLICYRASYPDSLVRRQQEVWQPLVDWAGSSLGAPLEVTTGIQVVEQPSDSRQNLRRAVEAYDDLALSSLSSAVRISGSLVIALALCEGQVTAEEAFAAAELDETYEMEQWGWDREAQERRDYLQSELQNAARFLELLKS